MLLVKHFQLLMFIYNKKDYSKEFIEKKSLKLKNVSQIFKNLKWWLDYTQCYLDKNNTIEAICYQIF